MSEHYLCIHGHFYQPPRENPWLEAIELQDSAYPYHDWNERITAECYGPNGKARILDGADRIRDIVNNYARISYNYGPTLLDWMEWAAPDVHQAILDADKESIKRFGGHGSAMAQVYNHIIMPLANRRDKETQVRWGIEDFRLRYGRMPEGMWLAETAVDLETLEILAEQGITFTVLAPYQAGRIRQMNGGAWEEIAGGVDPTRAYRQQLPSGREIALFFYDGPISQAIAFEGLLARGENLANRLLGAFNDERDWPQLVHIATDGETYGHHHKQGEMALAFALRYIEENNLAKLTNYGQFLALFPPAYDVEIVENTAWSCAHGIERWRSNCGCNSGGHGDWNQEWRGPLRAALDWLRDAVEGPYAEKIGQFVHDPWAARDEYVQVIFDRTTESTDAFIAHHATRDLTEAERIELWELLELQRHALLMYTSCGWFFDELSGIETVQVIMYAGRVVQLAQRLFPDGDFEAPFVALLAEAKSNIPDFQDGRWIYEHWVKAAEVDAPKVAAHFAISSLFETYPAEATIYSYRVDTDDYAIHEAGRTRLVTGRARFTSRITGEREDLTFGVFSFGDHNISAGVRPYAGAEAYRDFADDIAAAFNRVDFTEVIRILDHTFPAHQYALKSLFRDEQRKILRIVLDTTLEENEAIYRQMYENRIPLMRFLNDLQAPLPTALRTAAEFVLNTDLKHAFAQDVPDLDRVHTLLADTQSWGVTLDTDGLSFALKETVGRLMARFHADPDDLALLEMLEGTITTARTLPFGIMFAEAQNLYYDMLHGVYLDYDSRARRGSAEAREWTVHFLRLGDRLGFELGEEQLERVRATPSAATVTQEALAPQRIPRATYRIQFNHTFTFDDAREIIPYLDDLGISDLYASPILRASPGSMHGYDITDHNHINPELGGEDGLDRLATALRERNIGLIVDMVPNHMGISDPANGWWQDVIENGPSSLYASYFDIDWHPVKRELEDKILLPILGDQYGKVLESGQLRLAYTDGAFCVHYWGNQLPLAPQTYARILSFGMDDLVAGLGEEHEHVRELQSILTALSYLPPATDTDAERMAERNREKEVIKRRVATLYDTSAEIQEAIDTAVAAFNGDNDDPHGADLMDALLAEQPFRPAYWRVATEEINYRRFFDINELAAIRVEDPAVFQATHERILRLLAEGKATGLRIDHPDGLWDPTQYFRQLQERYVLERVRLQLPENERADDLEWTVAEQFSREWERDDTGRQWPLYVVAEKILAEGEPLPETWAVSGTTGYDFLNSANGIFVRTESQKAFDRAFAQFTGLQLDFRNLTNSTKKMIMLVSLASEINALANQLERIAEHNRLYRDFTLTSLTFALREVIACLTVYRTYTNPRTERVSAQDAVYIEAAVAEAKQRNPRTAGAVFDFIQNTLLLQNRHEFRAEDRPGLLAFVMKWQQVTGPVMAKGVEDTAFYVYSRLISLNEVGGHPAHFGHSVAAFHAQNTERHAHWPHSLLATATHDTKRGEDTRARINVLSELPEEWEKSLARWSKRNAMKKTTVKGEQAPDRKDEYFLYQTMLGTWPLGGMDAEGMANFRVRMTEYMTKAIKEAKVHTSWINPNEEYDRATREFIARLLPDDASDPFITDFRAFQARIAYHGQWNALAQTLLKLTAPGVPDIYQGNELWDLSLVDPDNRRPVDYRQRAAMLAELQKRVTTRGDDRERFTRDLVTQLDDGCIKLYLTHCTLAFRRDYDDLFAAGDYLPLEAQGAKREHICAYVRAAGDATMLVAVPRMTVGLTNGEMQPPLGAVWGDTRLLLPRGDAGGAFRNIFTGETLAAAVVDGVASLPIAELLARFPVALLARLPDA